MKKYLYTIFLLLITNEIHAKPSFSVSFGGSQNHISFGSKINDFHKDTYSAITLFTNLNVNLYKIKNITLSANGGITSYNYPEDLNELSGKSKFIIPNFSAQIDFKIQFIKCSFILGKTSVISSSMSRENKVSLNGNSVNFIEPKAYIEVYKLYKLNINLNISYQLLSAYSQTSGAGNKFSMELDIFTKKNKKRKSSFSIFWKTQEYSTEGFQEKTKIIGSRIKWNLSL